MRKIAKLGQKWHNFRFLIKFRQANSSKLAKHAALKSLRYVSHLFGVKISCRPLGTVRETEAHNIATGVEVIKSDSSDWENV